MKFSKATDYGLLLLVHLARLEGDGLTSVREIAACCEVPERFLANIVRQLAGAGIVSSRRGVGGGIRLARDPAEISVADVVRALDGPIRLFDCQSTPSGCMREGCCTMKPFWTDVQDGLTSMLEGAKIGDFVNRPAADPQGLGGRAALCAG